MNIEEKEIIKRLRETILLDKEVFGQNSKNFEVEEILLNYIDKLQKENEELHRQVDVEFVEENYIEKSKVISKDKIKDILFDFIPQSIHEVELKTKILNKIRGDNND